MKNINECVPFVNNKNREVVCRYARPIQNQRADILYIVSSVYIADIYCRASRVIIEMKSE